MAAGHPFYIDFSPENYFPSDNARPELESTKGISLGIRGGGYTLQPEALVTGARPIQGPFASSGYAGGVEGLEPFLQVRSPYSQANTHLYIPPAQPVRRDYYDQLANAARSQGKQKSGSAPTEGIYTGYSNIQALLLEE